MPGSTLSSADPEETVIIRVLTSLTTMVHLGLMKKNNIWDILDATTGFICHPNTWIRQSMASLIYAISDVLPHVDKWCCVAPSLRPLLRTDLATFSPMEVLSSALSPVRCIFSREPAGI